MARFKLEIDDIAENQMKGRWDRFSVVLERYGDMCKEHVERPETRLWHWREEVLAD